MLEQLPDIYREHPAFLSSLATGKVYGSLLTGIYHTLVSQDQSGVTQSRELKGFTIVKVNSIKTIKLTTIDPTRAVSVGTTLGYKPVIVWKKDVEPSAQ